MTLASQHGHHLPPRPHRRDDDHHLVVDHLAGIWRSLSPWLRSIRSTRPRTERLPSTGESPDIPSRSARGILLRLKRSGSSRRQREYDRRKSSRESPKTTSTRLPFERVSLTDVEGWATGPFPMPLSKALLWATCPHCPRMYRITARINVELTSTGRFEMDAEIDPGELDRHVTKDHPEEPWEFQLTTSPSD